MSFVLNRSGPRRLLRVHTRLTLLISPDKVTLRERTQTNHGRKQKWELQAALRHEIDARV